MLHQNQGNNQKFGGDKKEGEWFLKKAEGGLRNKIIPHIPSFIETHHLTYLTLLWSGLIVLFSYFAKDNINWLWLVSLMIFFQYMSDLLDGALGRYRDTGLVKWGYYMDHFLDYLFLSSIVVGYSFLFPESFSLLFLFMVVIFGAFIVSTYLSFSVTNKFTFSFFKMGPTEGRTAFIVLNIFIMVFGASLFEKIMPFILGGSVLLLIIIVYKTQKRIWKIDMDNRKDNY